jgi:hypothetical protein
MIIKKKTTYKIKNLTGKNPSPSPPPPLTLSPSGKN